jgi:hypothetical protein
VEQPCALWRNARRPQLARQQRLPRGAPQIRTAVNGRSADREILEHDPEKLVLGLDPRMETGFPKRSCSTEMSAMQNPGAATPGFFLMDIAIH